MGCKHLYCVVFGATVIECKAVKLDIFIALFVKF